MKLIAKLTRAQRENLTSIQEECVQLWKKRLVLAEELSDKLSRWTELTGNARSLEENANAGKIEASQELLATKDQIGRLSSSIERHQNETDVELIEEVNNAAARALQAIKEIARELAPAHLESITALLAPFFEHRHYAKNCAEQSGSYGALVAFFGPYMKIAAFEDADAAFAQLERWRVSVTELLTTGTVWEYKGADTTA